MAEGIFFAGMRGSDFRGLFVAIMVIDIFIKFKDYFDKIRLPNYPL